MGVAAAGAAREGRKNERAMEMVENKCIIPKRNGEKLCEREIYRIEESKKDVDVPKCNLGYSKFFILFLILIIAVLRRCHTLTTLYLLTFGY